MLGFLFPGQGAQHVGMAQDVAERCAATKERLDEASEALGFDLAAIVREGPADRLGSTEITQPALLAVSVALLDAWRTLGGASPAMAAGHSLGEYSALVAAGVLDFDAAVRLVHERGRLMQQASPAGEGAMAAILGLDDDQVAACCAGAEGVVSPANYNSPGQIVIAGAATAVAQAIAACQAAGARRAVRLDVSVPSHCALMAPASERLAAILEDTRFHEPRLQVVQNVDAAIAPDAATIRANLLRQLVSPVRWAASVATMAASGIERFVECGPGNVLAGLGRRIDRRLAVRGIGAWDDLQSALEAFAAS